MSAVLAVDLGKTSCRAALWLNEERAARQDRTSASDQLDLSAIPDGTAEATGAPGLAFRDGAELAERAISSVYRQILEDIDPPRDLAVCIGAAGALTSPEGSRALAGRLSTLFPAGAIAVCSDAVIAHAGALDGRPGLVLAAGTGAVVIGIGARDGAVPAPADGELPATDDAWSGQLVRTDGWSGRLVRIDGWGPLLGDLGGGGWIGTAGLRAALRSYDGRGPETDLQAAAVARFGNLEDLPTRFADRSDGIRLAAGFAPTVAALAEANDQVSRQIMTDAAGHLAETVAAGWRRLYPPPPATGRTDPATGGHDGTTSDNQPRHAPTTDLRLAITGGLADLGPSLLEPLVAALALAVPGLTVERSLGGPLDGARRLATDRSTVHERLVYRTNTSELPREAAVQTCSG